MKREKLIYATKPRRLYGRLTGPRVLLASPEKCGTNLLIRVLTLFPQLRSAGLANGPAWQKEEHIRSIASVGPGQFITTHYAVHGISEIMDTEDIKGVFIIRDPRDVAISLYHYIMREPSHWCHSYFHEKLPDDSSRLMAAIRGVEEIPLDSIDRHFRKRFDYLTHPRFCTVRFEELVGPNGGGDVDAQRMAIQRLSEHLGLKITERDFSYIASRAYWRKSATFRKGQTGTWKQEMLPEHEEAIAEVAGQLLLDLGYEENLDWRLRTSDRGV